jgi:hypothetical protein
LIIIGLICKALTPVDTTAIDAPSNDTNNKTKTEAI